MKKILTVMAAAIMACSVLFGGCVSAVNGLDGRDGKDGQGFSIYDAYEAAKTTDGNENLTFDEFLREYLSYTDSDIDLQSAINRSLMSGVSILSRFSYTTRYHSSLGFNTTKTEYKVFTGSGVIVWLDKTAGDAYVVTNCHVVYDDISDDIFCTDVRLYLYGQDVHGDNYVIEPNYNITGDENYRIQAEVIGASQTYDIALLKVTNSEVIKRSDATAASFTSETDVYIGEKVYAIGNPSGEGLSAADGIISKDSEYVELSLSSKENLTDSDYNEYRVMRTTAPINPGNSGGALYNERGEIIAIVNAKDEASEIDNMGYALPAITVKPVLRLMYDEYVSNGNKMRKVGGVKVAMLNTTLTIADSYARFNNRTNRAEITELVKVSSVLGYPAKNKLLQNDVIKAIKVESSEGTVKAEASVTRYYYLDLLLYVQFGDTLTLTVERDGEDMQIQITYDSDKYFNQKA